MAEKIRYTRKDLKAPDEFMSSLARGVGWIKENRLKALAPLGVIVLLAAGVLGYRAYSRWEENKATRDLWPHLNRAREFLQAPSQADADKLARLEAFLAGNVASHPDTKAAVYARYYLASIAFIRKDYDMAAARFRESIPLAKENDIMPFLMREGLAQSLEAKGDNAGASAAYRDASLATSGEMRIQALLGEARTLAIQGRREEAAAVYRRIMTESPDGPMKEFAETRLAHLN